MHTSTVLSIAILLIPNIVTAHDGHPHQLVERSTLNGPCTGSGGAPGVCISTADCTADGGTHIQNACAGEALFRFHCILLRKAILIRNLLGLPADIRCCTKASCGSGGNCRFSNTCASGNTLTGLCPGPTEFKCCLPGTSPAGGFPPPRIPAVGACKATAVSGAQKTVSGLPGKVREIFCTRDCACPGSSEHCCGMAIDFMCTSGGGVSDTALILAHSQCLSCHE